jgi:hypothetical protein
MPAVARAEIVIDQPIDAVFGQLVDFGRWSGWMPPLFRPARGPARALAVADRIVVLLGGALPMALRVLRVSQPGELAWRGGIPGILVGEHAFYLNDLGGGRTRVLSEERFSGLLAHAPLVQGLVERSGSKAGAAMLGALASAFR